MNKYEKKCSILQEQPRLGCVCSSDNVMPNDDDSKTARVRQRKTVLSTVILDNFYWSCFRAFHSAMNEINNEERMWRVLPCVVTR